MKRNTVVHIEKLTKRAARLAERVESATQLSPESNIRRVGAQFADVLDEWIEGLHELHEIEDETLEEALASFETRLGMAEKKIETWPGMPPGIIEQVAPRRRRRSKAKAA